MHVFGMREGPAAAGRGRTGPASSSKEHWRLGTGSQAESIAVRPECAWRCKPKVARAAALSAHLMVVIAVLLSALSRATCAPC